jgi:hypothetical protein
MKLTLSFPGALRWDVAALLASLLLVLQLATGTSLEFAELTFLAVVFSVLAVNLAGLRTVAGLCFAVVALQVFVVAEIAKVFYREPGESRLEVPVVTMGVMALSMASLCLGAFVSRPFKPRRVLFRPTLDPELLRVIAVLSLIIGIGSMMSGHLAGETEDGAVRLGGVAGLLRRFSGCGPLAVIAGTAYTLVISRGTRLFSSYNAVPVLVQFALGVFYSSKQGMFEPLFCTFLTAVAFRFAWRPAQLFWGVIAVLLGVFVIFPFGQVARNHTHGLNFLDTLQKNIDYFRENLHNPTYFLDQYDEYKQGLEADDSLLYFEKPNGVLERMSLIKPADVLIHSTLAQGTAGWKTIGPGLVDLLPRVILPHPWVNVPNEMGYKAGMLDEDNISTCISFGFAADSFGSFGWAGAAILPFLLGILIITVTRVLTPAFSCNIWAVFFFTTYNHAVAEASVGGVASLFITQTAWVVVTVFLILFSAKIWVSLRRHSKLVETNPTRPSLEGASLDSRLG